MDTFMDKLAQKLTAQEMIKANAAADAAELSRLREQTAEYEALLRKIKEDSEQSASKIEQSAVKAEQNATNVEHSAVKIEQGAAKVEESASRIEQGAAKVEENAGKVEQGAQKVEQAAVKTEELIAAAIAKIEEIQAAGQDTEGLNALLEEMKKIQTEQHDQLTDHVHKESVKVYRNVQAVILD
ncbi:MAG: hypothetical protein ACI4TB_02025, partial [Lachnospiraceae bacterium]